MEQHTAELTALITLYDIFGENLILNPRPSFSEYGWLPKDPVKLDLLTGSPLVVAGSLPVICSSSVISQEVTDLLERAHLIAASWPQMYHTKEEYVGLLNLFRYRNKKVAFNHVHPPHEADDKLYWIEPELVAFLNNKANLEKLVPAGHTPRRLIIPPDEVEKVNTAVLKPPLVIKAASQQSTGAGYDVIICRSKEAVDHALEYFRPSTSVVLEEFVELKKVYNIQFARTVHGQTVFLGASEQITDPDGHYVGNWIIKDDAPPDIVLQLGRTIMECACRLGFFGIGGFDIGIAKDGRALAFDLNFRLNGSTPALLLRHSIFRNHQASVMLFRTWQTNLGWPEFSAACRELIDSKYFLPLSIFDPAASPYGGAYPLLTGVLTGTSKEDISNKQRLLADYGII